MVPRRQRPVIVLCPHFAPDTAPTGIVMTRIVDELVGRGHRIHVVTSLPWYAAHAIEPAWQGPRVRRERTDWGSIIRVDPFAGDDKSNLVRRALGFVGFTALAGLEALRIGGWFQRADAVIAMSPPLTLAITGRLVAATKRASSIFNVQDIFPDAAVETGAITNSVVISAASALERVSYRTADAVTVLSDDLRDNVAAKIPARRVGRIRVIPNFVDTDAIRPGGRMTAYRAELGIGVEPVVLYAGNVGFSQSIELMFDAARELPQVTFLINGSGAARRALEKASSDLRNVRFADFVPSWRLSELLATGDVHVVPLKRGLGRVSVPSKTYSIMAAGRPVVASVDEGTAVPKMLLESGGGVSVPPDDGPAFTAAIQGLLADPFEALAMGERGRAWVVDNASPGAVGAAYSELIDSMRR
jgi:putative colanic acid biosynthesis glycosyltransferase WcaI